MPSHVTGRTGKAGRRGSVFLLLGVAGLAAAVSLSFLAPVAAQETVTPQDMVRWDWYFRESLLAIDDWEEILAQREADLGRERLVPEFPVPSDGQAVTWPNPIPRSLLPLADRELRVRVALADKVCASSDSAATTRLWEMRRCRLPNWGTAFPATSIREAEGATSGTTAMNDASTV